MNIDRILRDLKIAINGNDHTVEEWKDILTKINVINSKATIRYQMKMTPYLEVVDVKKETEIIENINKDKNEELNQHENVD